MDDDWDAEEWERWCALTEDEQEAEIAAVEVEYARWFDSLSPVEQYRHRRRLALRSCRTNRKLAAMFPSMREYLVGAQNRLVALRAERRSGTRV